MKNKNIWPKGLAAAVLATTLGLSGTSLCAQETSRKALANPAPTYPESAKRFRLAGTVKVQVLIGADGKIKDVQVIGGHPILVSAVQETLKNWKYAPASVETTATLQFNFHE